MGRSSFEDPQASPPESGPASAPVDQTPREEQLPLARRIYCNRDLRLDQVDTVGFDMDYTLAVYNQAEMDRVSIEATVQKLIERGYPEHLRDVPIDTQFPVRGLLVDKQLGNIVKTNRFRYPKRAYHGTQPLTREARKETYAKKRIRAGTRRFHAVDTLYALSEVSLYAGIIDGLEARGESVDYRRVFDDVRTAIDDAHRDGTIKNMMKRDLPRFVERDPALGATLHRLRSAGKRLFLLTNSGPDYTEAMMRYLLQEPGDDSGSWRRYFDVLITAARKPGFFTGSEPFVDVDAPDREVTALKRGRMYQGGNLRDLERMTGMEGDQVLYAGDHIYGDVLRAKKVSAWRTLMIIQELTDELAAVDAQAPQIAQLHRLTQTRYWLLDVLRDANARLKAEQRRSDAAAGDPPSQEASERTRAQRKRQVDDLRSQLRATEAEYETLEAQVADAYHPYWGSIFKAGSELSSFGEQVERFACIYTDRVTNLSSYAPTHHFRGPRHRMAHEH